MKKSEIRQMIRKMIVETKQTLNEKLSEIDASEIIKEKICNHKMKKLIKEQMKILLTESTHATVGILNSNGSVTSVYVHSDGYPEAPDGVGSKLKKYYNDTKKIEKLISLGDLSSLHKNIEPSGKHSFKGPEKDVTVAYGRDRGEKNVKPIKSRDKSNFLKDAGNNTRFAYLWDPKAKKWFYSDLSSDDRMKADLKKL